MRSSKEINWGPSIFLISYQVILIAILPFYFFYGTFHLSTACSSVILLYLTGLSITAGYHRYFSHRTFKTNPVMEFILLFFSSMSGQGSALRWSFDHRIHHAYVDTDKDPYCIKKGFWYAHFLWILEKPQAIEAKVVPDLIKNKQVMLQDRFYPLCMVLTNVLAFVFVGWICQDYWGAFFLAVWLRLFALHHFTWFINSLAHTWGDKPFSQEQSAVDNYIISLLTFGEGYHNYHHTFANDYRNGIKWYHFDPTKWLIWTLSKFKLAHHLKKMDPITIKKRMVSEHKSLLLDKLSKFISESREEMELQVQEISNRLMDEINKFSFLIERYEELKKDALNSEMIKDIQLEIKALKKSLNDDWKTWKHLSSTILKQEVIAYDGIGQG